MFVVSLTTHPTFVVLLTQVLFRGFVDGTSLFVVLLTGTSHFFWHRYFVVSLQNKLGLSRLFTDSSRQAPSCCRDPQILQMPHYWTVG